MFPLSEWIVSISGTEAGARLALILALMAAFLHALFGALQKGRIDPWTSRAAIDASYAIIAAPFALFVVPWPEPFLWPILAAAWAIHVGYKLLQAAAYTYGSYTVVYPIVRGTGPVFTVFGATIFFAESYSVVQWGGVVLLSGAILGLAVYNLGHIRIDRAKLPLALGLAFATGGFVAAYTTWDAYGIRATADPFTFLAWFFLIDGIAFPVAWIARYRRLPRPFAPVARLGVTGAFVAFASFGGIMLATRLDQVGEAAVLRETSVVFAAAIGWWFLGDPVGRYRAVLIGLIAAGAVIVEAGG